MKGNENVKHIETASGFALDLDADTLDDWEVLKTMREIDKGNEALVVDAVSLVLGDKNEKKLMAFLKKRDGRVKASAVISVFAEIMNEIKDGKN